MLEARGTTIKWYVISAFYQVKDKRDEEMKKMSTGMGKTRD